VTAAPGPGGGGVMRDQCTAFAGVARWHGVANEPGLPRWYTGNEYTGQAPRGGMGAMGPRIVIVSNRGPNDFVWRHGTWVTRTATGGLVSMLTPIARQPDVAWFCCVSEPPAALASRSALFTTAT